MGIEIIEMHVTCKGEGTDMQSSDKPAETGKLGVCRVFGWMDIKREEQRVAV